MYILIEITAADLTIGLYTEAGVLIGSEEVLDVADYQLRVNPDMQGYAIWSTSRPDDNAFPPYRSYPLERTLLHYTP